MGNTTYNTVSVGVIATLVIGGDATRKGMLVVNADDTNAVYLGPDASVTTANGLPLYSQATMSLAGHDGAWKGPLYAIAASGTIDVRYFAWGQ